MQVLINNFDSGPHKPGEVVLDVRNDHWQMEVKYEKFGATECCYFIYMFALNSDGKPAWTRLAANGGERPAGARLVARKFWGEIASTPP
jgi:hypothetical protein